MGHTNVIARACVAAPLLAAACAASAAPAVPDAPPRAGRHALIVAIGDYISQSIPALMGVGHDIDSAKKMAAAMQVPPENIRVLRDHEATAARIEQEIKDLDARTREGDRVFFYFTGHGTRWQSAAGGSCVEALLPADSRPLTNERVATLFKPISDKADKLFVFYDACHSGGILSKNKTRALGDSDEPKLTPKFTLQGAPDACSKPSNMRTRSLPMEAQKSGILEQNIVQISSSRPDEVSFDDADAGGLATQAFRDCLLGDAADLDKSGAVSMNELSVCAQKKIEARLSNSRQYTTQHMTMGGNGGMVPGWLGAATVVAAVTPAPAPAPIVVPAQPVAPPKPQPAVEANPAPGAALTDILAQRDPRRKVDIKTASAKLKIGKDALGMSITSSHNGYVYLVLLGSDQQSYYLLFPNERDKDNAIKANTPLQLPRPQWKITAGGPAGKDRMLVVVTESMRDLGMLAGSKAGPFVQSLTDPNGRARLQWLVGSSASHDKPECRNGGSLRETASVQRCSDAFGAAMTEIVEF